MLHFKVKMYQIQFWLGFRLSQRSPDFLAAFKESY